MHQLAPPNRSRSRGTKGVTLRQKLCEKMDDTLKDYIKTTALKKYKQEPKPLQVEAVFHLAKGHNTFLLAGTGYGKSRISEMYFDMIPGDQRAVVLVLNPLDALGENQVLEKNLAGYTAINLTKMNFDETISNAILDGDYNFIYLSPEIYLNSQSFNHIYFSNTFQNRLATIVIDEAHMIYIWGLVESSTAKTLTSVHNRHEDYGSFRPGYGKIGPHLLFRNDKPLLLLSATCRPVAVEAIMKCLKLNDNDLEILRGELTRPKIRIIRVEMDSSLVSSLDLIKVFPSATDVSAEDMVPTLIYSGSRNRTLTTMKVFDMARETLGACFVPRGKTIRRFHSCTGDQDKKDVVEDFSSAKVPVISCTMALGLGQNWKRVRMVVHVGRGDPANICQMIGRCGRDGRQGLAIMFVEKNRRGGKNAVNQFKRGAFQNNLDRMDAMAITPLCIRVAYSLDNLLGYVPLWQDDPEYIREKEREVKAGMCKCLCSNCAAEEAKKLMANLAFANQDNFDDIIQDKYQTNEVRNLTTKYPAKRAALRKRKIPDIETPIMESFKAQLTSDLHKHYDQTFGADEPHSADKVFGEEEGQAIVSYMHHINTPEDVRGIIGGECFDGQLLWLFQAITLFKTQQQQNTGPRPHKKARVTSAPALMSTSTPRLTRQCGQTNTNLSPLVTSTVGGAKPPSKTALAAQESRRRSLEKKAQSDRNKISKQNRTDQVACYIREGREKNEEGKSAKPRGAGNDQQGPEGRHSTCDATTQRPLEEGGKGGDALLVQTTKKANTCST
ncbi:hypothetical protein PSTG_16756 [Puccinia striiformis f. sp. tritici PST-78]|uniref:DNA 3'-5' helicase n=1 Tax=Puccinia striiformis f. sp. tritici PST-78 TaxID=1165861 RepID=A0A0L0URS9_9BASI|nr:hypothetical protein PSTG_16756 [Puccinia striiformis f. sp. tritici PST-78]